MIWIDPKLILDTNKLLALKLAENSDSDATTGVAIRPDGVIPIIYAGLRAALEASRYHVVEFGFDWRKDIDVSVHALADVIRDRVNNRPRPLHLVAHSQGSLVARRALQLLGPNLGRQLVDSLVLLGLATAGSFSAALGIAGTHELLDTVQRFGVVPPLGFDAALQSMTGLYQLLPWRPDPVDGTGVDKAIEWVRTNFPPPQPPGNALVGFRNPANWTSGVDPGRLTRLAGWAAGIDAGYLNDRTTIILGDQPTTVGGVKFDGGKLVPDPAFATTGDGTVPDSMARIPGVSRVFKAPGAEHMMLPATWAVIVAVRDVFAGRTPKIEPVVAAGLAAAPAGSSVPRLGTPPSPEEFFGAPRPPDGPPAPPPDPPPPVAPTPASGQIAEVSPPVNRRLKVYSFDPLFGSDLGNFEVAQLTVELPCEFADGGRLQPGPVGEYLEVVDFDATSRCFYPPVDLNHPHLLAQDGIPVSEGDPRFHQQMAYAVAMNTVRQFEVALGRTALWAPNLHRNQYGEVEAAPGHSLRLMFDVEDRTGIPSEGQNLIILATVKNVLHVRFFDGGGKLVVSADETTLMTHAGRVETLKNQLPRLRPPHELSTDEIEQVITAVTSIVGYALPPVHRPEDEYVGRLRVYPHAMREENAYYSPEKKALLFGYFPAKGSDVGDNLPGGMVFSCLSYDILAHETTHALLDGLHRYFTQPSNPDVFAFHEAFADVVALLQHFSHPEVLRHEIKKTQGKLEGPNSLGRLATQFGQATGHRGALRQYLGKESDPANKDALHTETEPHNRGKILVAAIFRAFINTYENRVKDLRRIAAGGNGLSPGELHPDMLYLLAEEATKSAQHLLRMCIRALDYAPPVDLMFGDYLRALVTADYDLVRDDDLGYRVSVVAAFRDWGIYLSGVRSLSVDSLLWKPLERRVLFRLRDFFLANPFDDWGLSIDRRAAYLRMCEHNRAFHEWVRNPNHLAPERANELGLCLDRATAPGSIRRDAQGKPVFQVCMFRPCRRIGPDGQELTDVVVELIQRRLGFFDADKQKAVDTLTGDRWTEKAYHTTRPDFYFRGGCTLIIDPKTGTIRYCIAKPVWTKPDDRLSQERAYRQGRFRGEMAAYLDPREENNPFAALHAGH